MSLPPLYAILDTTLARRHGWTPEDLVRALFDGGARLVQIRAKEEPSGPLLALCEAVVRQAEPYGALVIVNDRADVARLSGAAGVHVGQDDLPVRHVRALAGHGAIVGVSTHTIAQIDDAAREAASYLAVGPVFGTGTKDTGYAPVGLDLVREACARGAGKPIVAIGGMTLARAPEVIAAGAGSVAVISDLLAGGDPARRVREYVARLGG